MTLKSNVTTLKPAAAQSGAGDFVAQWTEARGAYPLYAALATQFNLAPLPHPAGELPPLRPTRDVFDSDLKWLDAIDEKVRAFQIRQLPSEILNASEESLRAFLHRQLRKAEKTTADRDKIDLLLGAVFCAVRAGGVVPQRDSSAGCGRCSAARAGGCGRHTSGMVRAARSDPRKDRALREPAGHDGKRPAGAGPLAEGFRGRDVLRSRRAGGVLPFQFSAATRIHTHAARGFERRFARRWKLWMPPASRRWTAAARDSPPRKPPRNSATTRENWKQPFHKDYTETSVSRAFEQFLALRADLEEALARKQSGAVAHTEVPMAPPTAKDAASQARPVDPSSKAPAAARRLRSKPRQLPQAVQRQVRRPLPSPTKRQKRQRTTCRYRQPAQWTRRNVWKRSGSN